MPATWRCAALLAAAACFAAPSQPNAQTLEAAAPKAALAEAPADTLEAPRRRVVVTEVNGANEFIVEPSLDVAAFPKDETVAVKRWSEREGQPLFAVATEHAFLGTFVTRATQVITHAELYYLAEHDSYQLCLTLTDEQSPQQLSNRRCFVLKRD